MDGEQSSTRRTELDDRMTVVVGTDYEGGGAPEPKIVRVFDPKVFLTDDVFACG